LPRLLPLSTCQLAGSNGQRLEKKKEKKMKEKKRKPQGSNGLRA